MKTKKALTLTAIVAGITIGTLVTRVPQDLVRLHNYNNQTQKALAQHKWLADSIRNSYTNASTPFEIAEGEATIDISTRITTERMMHWNTKKALTIYKNKTLGKLFEIYSNLQSKKHHRQEEKLKEKEQKKQPTYSI